MPDRGPSTEHKAKIGTGPPLSSYDTCGPVPKDRWPASKDWLHEESTRFGGGHKTGHSPHRSESDVRSGLVRLSIPAKCAANADCRAIRRVYVKASSAPRDEARPLNVHLIWRGLAVFAGAVLMTWPALYNGYPLLYPDSMSYLEDGRLVARAVFLHKFSPTTAGDGIYCLGILPLHRNVSPWPIVALNALLLPTPSGLSCAPSCRVER